MARDPVKISANLDDNSLTNEVFVGITDGTEQLLVNADGSANVTVNNGAGASAVNIQDGGNSITVDGTVAISGTVTVTATDLDIRDLTHVSDSVRLGDGTDLTNVTAAGELNVLATAQPGTDIGDVTINNAAGASAVNIQDGGNSITVDGSVTVSATDLDIRDLSAAQDDVAISDGTDTLAVNTDGSINVVISGVSGTPVADYDQVAALASAASSNHDYTASGGAFKPSSVSVSGESIGTFLIIANAVNIATLRTSVENPNAVYEFPAGFSIADTQVLRVTRTNDSNKAHSFESTINGSQE